MIRPCRIKQKWKQNRPALVTQRVAAVLGLREEPGRPLLPTLCEHLQSQRILLVLRLLESRLQPIQLVLGRPLHAGPLRASQPADVRAATSSAGQRLSG